MKKSKKNIKVKYYMRNIIDYINNVNEGLFSKSLKGTNNGKNDLSGFSDEQAVFQIARKESSRGITGTKDSDRKLFDGGWSNSNNIRKVTKTIDIKNQKDIYDFFNKLGSKFAVVTLELKWIDEDVKKQFKRVYGESCKVESRGLFITINHGMNTEHLLKLFNSVFYKI